MDKHNRDGDYVTAPKMNVHLDADTLTEIEELLEGRKPSQIRRALIERRIAEAEPKGSPSTNPRSEWRLSDAIERAVQTCAMHRHRYRTLAGPTR